MLTSGFPLAVMAQTAVFSDNFSNGSSFNGTSTPGGTPTASSTSYDFSSSKTGVESITPGNLTYGLNGATGSGFIEGQALFTTTPIALQTTGDYVDLTYTFTDTANLLAGGTSSYIMTGLFNSGGNAPVAGTAGVSGNTVTLSTTTGSSFATGNAANWQGYVGRLAQSGGNSEVYTRPLQNGAGTTSANQDVLGNNFGGGAYNNPGGTQVGGTVVSTLALTAGNQYTIDYRLTLSAGGVLTISDSLYNGAGTGGTQLASQSEITSSTPLTSSFDALAIGIRNSGTSLQPTMDLNQITITDDIQVVPEPSTFALAGLGALVFALSYRRRIQA